MLMQCEPIDLCFEAVKKDLQERGIEQEPEVIYLSPRGRTFSQKIAEEFASEPERPLVLLCGHYEGIDERVLTLLNAKEISIGDFVLTGGELGAAIIVDAVSRLIPGVLGDESSAVYESFHDDLLECPQYTRPEEYKGLKVPEVLLSGNHALIAKWRLEEAEKQTEQKRPDLYRIYRVGDSKVRALNGVSFGIRRGDFCSIVGTSGSGKSTLLNMLAGLEKPSKGEIIIAGSHIEKMKETELVRFRQQHIGFIFQSFNLMGTMDAIENVALPLTFQGVPEKERRERAIRMLKLVGLKNHMDHRPNQMSGGQQQRVGIARALVVNPEIIFADEPTGNLDSNTTMEVLQLIQKIVHEII